jgi:tRNA(Ile2) C34 agmatinyltransferase TiaS
MFNNKDIGEVEGEPRLLKLSPKEEAKARLAAAVAAEAAA